MANLSLRDDEKDDFQNNWLIFRKICLFKIPVNSPILQISEDLGFSVLVLF